MGWSFDASAGTIDGIPNGGGADADMNLWAVKVGSDGRVPDATSTLAMLGAAFLSLAGVRRRLRI